MKDNLIEFSLKKITMKKKDETKPKTQQKLIPGINRRKKK